MSVMRVKMFCGKRKSQPFWVLSCYFSVSLILLCFTISGMSTPIPTDDVPNRSTEDTSTTLSENSTSDDLYIIRAVVYEIGVLTDTNSTRDENPERHEEVNISFYDPPHKEDGLLDLDNLSNSQINVTGRQENVSQLI